MLPLRAVPWCICRTWSRGFFWRLRGGLRVGERRGFEFVDVFEDDLGHVGFEAGALEFEAFNVDRRFNSCAILFFGVIRVKLQL